MASNLHRFGIDDDDLPPDPRWKRAVNKLLKALVTNPRLLVGAESSDIILPDQNPAKPQRVTSATTGGAFYQVYQSDGDWFLQGGQVSGAQESSQSVDAINLGNVGTEPADGQIHWLEITGDGIVSGGRLQPGFKVTTIDEAGGSTLPANTFPTAASATGKKYHLRLGVWQNDTFFPDTPGHVGIGWCGNQYSIAR